MCKVMEDMLNKSVHERNIEIAVSMLGDGMASELVAKYTGLTVDEVKKLADNIPAK